MLAAQSLGQLENNGSKYHSLPGKFVLSHCLFTVPHLLSLTPPFQLVKTLLQYECNTKKHIKDEN